MFPPHKWFEKMKNAKEKKKAKNDDLNKVLKATEQYDFFFKNLVIGLLATDQSKTGKFKSIVKL